MKKVINILASVGIKVLSENTIDQPLSPGARKAYDKKRNNKQLTKKDRIELMKDRAKRAMSPAQKNGILRQIKEIKKLGHIKHGINNKQFTGE